MNALKNSLFTVITIIVCLFFGSRNVYAQYTVQTANFTDAVLLVSNPQLPGYPAEPLVPGTLGEGVQPLVPVTLSGLKINPAEGLIEIWVQPKWSGSDGENHRLWYTNKVNGRQLIVEKSGQGMLRAELSTPSGLTVARSDVSGWKPGEWHHIAVGWVSNNGKQVGLALWIDKVAVDGPITPHGIFDPSAMPDTLTIGEGTSNVVYDELIIRPDLNAEGPHGMVACVYRDYFRTAPYNALRINPWATRVPSDLRAVAGLEKQFGLQACKQGLWEPVTEQVVRYGQWAYFDAKELIQWSTSDSSIAEIDSTGRVKAFRPGQCEVFAEFHKLKAHYTLTVISADKPDLGIICMQLSPSYRNDAVNNHPQPGEPTTVHVRFGNFGNRTLEQGTNIRFSLIPDSIRNYRLDQIEKLVKVMESTFNQSLSIGEEAEVSFEYPFPDRPTWMKLELDHDNNINEFCEANNVISELCDARPIQIGFNRDVLQSCLSDQKINHVGSLSYYDWLRAEKQRMDLMLQEAVWPTTGVNGVEEAYRIDSGVLRGC